MDIRSELEHANYRAVNKSELTDEMISELGASYEFILVIDVSKRDNEAERLSYIDALVKADVISHDQVESVAADENLVIIVPLHTERVATDIYRHIPHASHFVSMWVDGKPFVAC